MLGLLQEAYGWYQIHKGPFELLALLLAVTGTAFAVLSISDGRKMTGELRAVFDHLTTKEVGVYPGYMAEIERLVSQARESICIACDFPGYGVWSDRGRYGAYVRALENRKAERIRHGHPLDIQLLTLDAVGRERALRDRLPDANWKDYVKHGGFAASRRLYEELERCVVP